MDVSARIVDPPIRTVAHARRARQGRRLGRQLGGVVVALAIWELLSATRAVDPSTLPSLFRVADQLYVQAGPLASSLGATLEAWAIGLAIAVVAGALGGMAVGRWGPAEALTDILVRMMRPLPSLALIPIAILLAGLGLKMTAGLVAFSAFWPVFINARYGARQIDRRLLDNARMLDLRGPRLALLVIFPATLPAILTGVQVAISLAIVVTVSVELVGGTGGLGQYVLVAQEGGAISAMYAGIVVGGFIGWALNSGFLVVVRRLVPWRYQRSEDAS